MDDCCDTRMEYTEDSMVGGMGDTVMDLRLDVFVLGNGGCYGKNIIFGM